MVNRLISRNVNVKNNAVQHFGELFIIILPYLKRPVSAEYISKKIRVKPSRIRAVLNKLFNHNLIDYKRCFDDDTGKYTYVWTLKKEKLKSFLKENSKPASDFVEHETVYDFVCTGCKQGYDFDTASDYSFKCYKCGSFIDSAN